MNYDLFSAAYALIIAFIACVVLGAFVIPKLHNFGQNVRDDGPKSHLKKQGTPSMGGIFMICAFAIATLFFVKDNPDAIVVLLITVGYGLVGFLDDYIKVVKKRSLGLRAWQKVVFQLIVTILFAIYLLKMNDFGTEIYVPFTKGFYINLGWLYVPFLFFVMVGTVNSVNLTDGLDGLASGVTVLVATYFVFIAYAVNKGLIPVCGAAIGALLGFLVFNSYPAKVFMGDTGSLALGGFVASVAILTKMPIMLVIVGFVYVCESLSVMIQVGYFKLTGGKRIFKMAPIHHHFELSGLQGIKVVELFTIATAVLCLLGFVASKNLF
ncbi:MAG: phospho-N-acetylmuramoyl-pentapeptide-transferase [Lachnospirales bacterium]